MKRVFLIVLDSVGAGAMPDAADFGDAGANTLGSVARSEKLEIPNLRAMGLGNVPGLAFLGPVEHPTAAVGRMAERSCGKDTTIGHWELAGIVSPSPLPTYPAGFPQEVLDAFTAATGRGVLCNRPYSGTEVIRDYGREHLATGKFIVYTSADSVFQIAAHEDLVPLEELYAACRAAREILTGPHAVGRVIARPFTGDWPYTRTANRHDFSLAPPGKTMLDVLSGAGLDCLGVGKISDIFAGRGLTDSVRIQGNRDGMEQTLAMTDRAFHGLCFVNLVDFDMRYGHRQDVDGYAAALTEFDRWLPSFLEKLGPEDLVLITADHGCDPGDDSTDHTREYVPLLAAGPFVRPANLGTRTCFADVAATVTQALGVAWDGPGTSFFAELGTARRKEPCRGQEAAWNQRN